MGLEERQEPVFSVVLSHSYKDASTAVCSFFLSDRIGAAFEKAASREGPLPDPTRGLKTALREAGLEVEEARGSNLMTPGAELDKPYPWRSFFCRIQKSMPDRTVKQRQESTDFFKAAMRQALESWAQGRVKRSFISVSEPDEPGADVDSLAFLERERAILMALRDQGELSLAVQATPEEGKKNPRL